MDGILVVPQKAGIRASPTLAGNKRTFWSNKQQKADDVGCCLRAPPNAFQKVALITRLHTTLLYMFAFDLFFRSPVPVLEVMPVTCVDFLFPISLYRRRAFRHQRVGLHLAPLLYKRHEGVRKRNRNEMRRSIDLLLTFRDL